MIIGFLRLGLISFAIMFVVYIVLSFYSRSVRRDKLEREWDEEVKTGDRDAFVEAGLEEYDGSLRRKLIFGVFVVPYIIIAILVYIVNFQ